MNRIRLPSGDHHGFRSFALSFVSWRRPVPSERLTKISSCGARLKNVIQRPSGDGLGPCTDRDPPMRVVGAPLMTPAAGSNAATLMELPFENAVNATDRPSAETLMS